MNSDWLNSRNSWNKFLEDIEAARRVLNCSLSNAWFRGQSDNTWALRPSLFRREDRIDADRQKAISRLESEIGELKQNEKTYRERQNDVRRSLARLRKTESLLELRHSQEDGERLKIKLAECRATWDAKQLQLQVLKSTHYGEYDAFQEFSFRAGNPRSSSWETLAEMQHHRVPTRLLDWTEVLAIGIYFALGKYIAFLTDYWRLEKHDSNSTAKVDEDLRPYTLPSGLPTPRLWILNPYRLSRKARGENALWDPTRESDFDYFQCFFVSRNWRYELPVPIYSPWRNPRIAAQQGMFTVHGLSKAPLDDQLKCTRKDSDSLLFVDCPPEAAVYGVKEIMNLLGLNTFAIFRDLDSLGSTITTHLLSPKPHVDR